MAAPRFNIATILPMREHFSAAGGDIAKFVRDTTIASAYARNITVFGRHDDKKHRFNTIRYQPIEPVMPMLYGRRGGYARAMVNYFKARMPNMIEVHNRIGMFQMMSRNFASTPISLHFHSDPLTMKGAITPKQRWQILSRADAIYCSSDYIRRRFLTGLEAGRTDHVHVLYPYQAPAQVFPKERFILYSGAITPDHGALELAQAAKEVLPYFPKWRIVFANSPLPKGKHNTPYLQNVISVLKMLDKQALFLGPQSEAKMSELTGRAAISVIPTLFPESSGRSAIASLISGCALMTSGQGSLAEITGQAGLIVNPVTAQGIALSLQGLLEDDNILYNVQQLCNQQSHYFELERGCAYLDSLRHYLLSKGHH